MKIDWDSTFSESQRPRGATAEELDSFARDLRRPLDPAEIREARASQTNPWPAGHELHNSYQPLDPSTWRVPSVTLPASYRSLLAWSNGPWVRRDERELGFFGTADVREYLLAYQFPHYMPGAVPIAFDGGGVFACFDTRGGLVDGEYPILVAASGDLDYASALPAAASLVEVCTGRTPIDQELRG